MVCEGEISHKRDLIKMSCSSGGHPDISDNARHKALEIFERIYESYGMCPHRVSSSVEGGVTLLYDISKGVWPFVRHATLLIEIYNDQGSKDSVVYAMGMDGKYDRIASIDDTDHHLCMVADEFVNLIQGIVMPNKTNRMITIDVAKMDKSTAVEVLNTLRKITVPKRTVTEETRRKVSDIFVSLYEKYKVMPSKVHATVKGEIIITYTISKGIWPFKKSAELSIKVHCIQDTLESVVAMVSSSYHAQNKVSIINDTNIDTHAIFSEFMGALGT